MLGLFGKNGYKKLVAGMIFVFMGITVLVPSAKAEQSASGELSLTQGISMALSNNETVKKAAKEVERTEEWRNYRYQQLSFVPTAPAFTAAVEVPWARMLSADLEWRMSKKGFTAKEDAVAMDACNKYWNILKAQEKEKVAELGEKTALKQLQNAQAGYRVGNLANISLLGAQTQYQAAQATLISARNDLDKAYVAFNQLIGIGVENRPKLSDTVQYKPLEVNNLEYEVARVLESAPAVWQAEQMIEMQKLLQDMMFYTGEYRPYEARKLEMEQVQLDAASTRKLFDQTTRSLYYGIKNIEEAYAGTQERVKLAEENYRVKKVMFDVGMITAAELAADEKALADSRSALFDLACTHEYMKLAFEKPWAADAGALASGGK